MLNQPKVCLVIIFNHRYDKNIPILEQIYRERFKNIKYIVPFYDGDREDVIPVYESSYQFQGYLIQALDGFYSEEFEYYVFVADDMILAPHIDENNILDELNINGKDAFITGLCPLNSPYLLNDWSHAEFTSRPFFRGDTMYKCELPDYEEAVRIMQKRFGTYKEYYEDDFFTVRSTQKVDIDRKNQFIKKNGGTNRVPYPLVQGYSDFFVIRKSSLKKFARICGVFSAMNLFAEVGLPTAMVLTCPTIQTFKDTDYSYKCFWTKEDKEAFNQRHHYNISELMTAFEEKILLYHPVKLSMWSL